MRELLDSILVIGHYNPDTDAAASATAYAHFLNAIERYEKPVVPSVLGPLTPQTKYVFDRAQIDVPVLVDNIEPRVGHAINSNPKTLAMDSRLGEAFEKIVREDVSMLPVVDVEGQLCGSFSNRSDATRFLMGFDPLHLWGSLLTIDDLLSLPGMQLVSEHRPEPQDSGELCVALFGDRTWANDISRADVLVCGSLEAIRDIPDARLPHCIVLINNTDLRGTTGLARINKLGLGLAQFNQSVASLLTTLNMHIRLGSLSLPTGICVGELDRLSDIDELFRDNHHALPVVNQTGKLLGVVSRSDIKNHNRSQAILVDHFETPQAVKGIESAEVLEILDHHRIGDLETCSPVRVQCRPVGSSCTIVATNYLDHKVEITKGIATLLLGGIVADTLVLTGPTATKVDHEVAQQLAEIANVDLQAFGRDVLVAGDDLVTSEPNQIWHRDRKEFSIRDRNVSIAQLETASLQDLPADRLNEFSELARCDHEKNGRYISLLVLTDVLQGDSWICAAEADDVSGIVRTAFASSDSDPKPGWISAPGVVSRKKQIVPRLMTALASA